MTLELLCFILGVFVGGFGATWLSAKAMAENTVTPEDEWLNKTKRRGNPGEVAQKLAAKIEAEKQSSQENK